MFEQEVSEFRKLTPAVGMSKMESRAFPKTETPGPQFSCHVARVLQSR